MACCFQDHGKIRIVKEKGMHMIMGHIVLWGRQLKYSLETCKEFLIRGTIL